jgi:hypothetical protein
MEEEISRKRGYQVGCDQVIMMHSDDPFWWEPLWREAGKIGGIVESGVLAMEISEVVQYVMMLQI